MFSLEEDDNNVFITQEQQNSAYVNLAGLIDKDDDEFEFPFITSCS